MSNDQQNEPANSRRQFSPAPKIQILREHLLDRTAISAVCEKHQLTPTQFYQWQKTFLENGAAAFAKATGPRAPPARPSNGSPSSKTNSRQGRGHRRDHGRAHRVKKSLGES
jgi:transposase-like protein